MAKLHFPRKNISLDMTAMCDVAFLLLTFFMLATRFKPDEPVIVDTPTSVSEFKLPESDVISIIVEKSGAVYFGIDDQNTRAKLIDQMGSKYKVQFTPEERQAFILTAAHGVPMGGLKQFLATESNQRANLKQPGIPVDSTHNELKDWVDLARRYNDPVPRVAIKADGDVPYHTVKRVMDTLQELNVNRFNMVTKLEAKPADYAPREEPKS